MTRHEFYQTNEIITLSVFVKNAPKDAVIEISSSAVRILPLNPASITAH